MASGRFTGALTGVSESRALVARGVKNVSGSATDGAPVLTRRKLPSRGWDGLAQRRTKDWSVCAKGAAGVLHGGGPSLIARSTSRRDGRPLSRVGVAGAILAPRYAFTGRRSSCGSPRGGARISDSYGPFMGASLPSLATIATATLRDGIARARGVLRLMRG